MVFVLVLTIAMAASGIGLLALMVYRDEPVLGAAGLSALLLAGTMSTAYAAITSI